jgi:2-iminoacetate synthase ThiH
MGQTTLTPEELEAMLDRAAKRGAKQALAAIGLHDENAAVDVREMRSLLEAWRDTRRSIWNTSIKLLTVAILTFISGAVWMTINKG